MKMESWLMGKQKQSKKKTMREKMAGKRGNSVGWKLINATDSPRVQTGDLLRLEMCNRIGMAAAPAPPPPGIIPRNNDKNQANN